MKIGVLNSGGDCPGLNAVINGVVGAADKLGWEVYGFIDGFEGLLPEGGIQLKKFCHGVIFQPCRVILGVFSPQNWT